MATRETFVILGAGAKTAGALRDQGFDGRIVLIGEERHRPYERPPLSKGYLAGNIARQDVYVHQEDWYAEHEVELRLGVQASCIDRNALKQPICAAASMLGDDMPYSELPYFYTDQYDLGMEYVGYVEPGGYERVLFRGNVTGRVFIAFWLAKNRVLAGMAVNVWDAIDQIQALIDSGCVVNPVRLSDPGHAIEDVAQQVTR